MDLMKKTFDYGSQWVRAGFHLHTSIERKFIDDTKHIAFVERNGSEGQA